MRYRKTSHDCGRYSKKSARAKAVDELAERAAKNGEKGEGTHG